MTSREPGSPSQQRQPNPAESIDSLPLCRALCLPPLSPSLAGGNSHMDISPQHCMVNTAQVPALSLPSCQAVIMMLYR